MPITSKSNIRSRWYRPNEKPLKSEGVPQLNEPKGEILINKNDKLIDDLSSVKPPPASKREEKEIQIIEGKIRKIIGARKEDPVKVENPQIAIVRKIRILDRRVTKERTHKTEKQETSLKIVKILEKRKILQTKRKVQKEKKRIRKINPN